MRILWRENVNLKVEKKPHYMRVFNGYGGNDMQNITTAPIVIIIVVVINQRMV